MFADSPSWKRTAVVALLSLAALTGCGKRLTTEGTMPAVNLDELSAPAGVLLYGGTDNLNAMLEKAQTLASQALPLPASLVTLVQGQLTQELQLTSPAGLDLAQPAHFAVLDTKKYADNPMALILGMTSQVQLEGTLPAAKKKNDRGNAYSVGSSPRPVFVNFVGRAVVFTHHPAIFGENKDFLARLAAAKISDGLSAIAAVGNIHALYRADMEKTLQQTKESTGQAAMPGKLKDSMASGMRWLQDLAADTKLVRLTAAFPPEGASLTLSAQAKPGSNLDQSLAKLKPRTNTLLSLLPAETPVFCTMEMDFAPLADLVKKLINWSSEMMASINQMVPPAQAKMLEASRTMQAKILPLMDAVAKAFSGEAVVGVHALSGSKELALVGVYGIRDADAAAGFMAAFKKIYQEPALVQTYAELGMKLSFRDADFKVREVPVTTMEMDTSKLDLAGNPMAKLMGGLWHWQMAMDKKLWWFTMGEKGRAALEAHLGGKVKGGLDKLPGARAVPGQLGMLYLSPMELARLLLPEGHPLIAQLPKTQSGLALRVTRQASSLSLLVELPAEQTKGFAPLVAAIQSKLQGQ